MNFSSSSVESAAAPARLVVRGDDLGFSHACNAAIVQCHREGIMTSVELLVPTPWFLEGAKLLAENPTLDVGVHLALTSEWDYLKWRPVSHCRSLVDANGYFFPMLAPDPHYPGRSVVEQPWNIDDIEREFRAQIELARRHVPRISHITGHMGATTFAAAVTDLVRRLAREYALEAGLHEVGMRAVTYLGAHRTAAEKKTSFLCMLDSIEAGETHLFVDHPGEDHPELRAIYNRGYQDVAADRQGVTDVWTDAEVKDAIRRRNIRLISYADCRV